MSKYTLFLAALLSTAAFNVQASENGSDWLETYNRSMFNFNYQLDKYTLKPLAKGYRAITTPDIRARVSSALSNTHEPISAINHTLQGNFKDSLVSVGRFVINTTLGLGGMFDVADGWGLKKKSTGFDKTLASYCVPDGPFVVLPLIGPATPRSFVSYIADSAANPVYIASANDSNYKDKINIPYTVVSAIDARERSLEFLDDMEKNSVDFYATARSAYIQNRQGMNKLCSSVNKDQKADYDFDFEMEE